jgi:hypothetical protein
MNMEIKRKEGQSIDRRYMKVLGKKIQVSTYPDYIESMTRIGRLALVKSWSIQKGDYWYRNDKSKSPIGAFTRSIEVGNGVVKLVRVFIFRYSFDIGWLFS